MGKLITETDGAWLWKGPLLGFLIGLVVGACGLLYLVGPYLR